MGVCMSAGSLEGKIKVVGFFFSASDVNIGYHSFPGPIPIQCSQTVGSVLETPLARRRMSEGIKEIVFVNCIFYHLLQLLGKFQVR